MYCEIRFNDFYRFSGFNENIYIMIKVIKTHRHSGWRREHHETLQLTVRCK